MYAGDLSRYSVTTSKHKKGGGQKRRRAGTKKDGAGKDKRIMVLWRQDTTHMTGMDRKDRNGLTRQNTKQTQQGVGRTGRASKGLAGEWGAIRASRQ